MGILPLHVLNSPGSFAPEIIHRASFKELYIMSKIYNQEKEKRKKKIQIIKFGIGLILGMIIYTLITKF